MSIIFLIILSAIVIFSLSGRPYIYLAYQHLGPKVGLNFNNIATLQYVDWIKSQSLTPKGNPQAIFLNQKIDSSPASSRSPEAYVLGEATADDNKWIEISLSEQKLYMKDHGNVIGSFLISSGKWAPTLTGEFRIWTKLRYTRMTGGSKALGTYYDLPNVPYTMYYDRGFSVHGAYWHNNFGHPMSHGCVNMRPDEAAIVYNWASVGTRVIVHN